MLTKMSAAQRVKMTLRWIRHLPRQIPALAGSRSKRFALLTPPLFTKQLVYDNRHKSIFSLTIRDLVDYQVIDQIFVKHDYGLRKLTRHTDIEAFYSAILKHGKTPVVIDCGANSGMSVKYFTQTYQDASIVAIEPDPDNLASARKNNLGDQVKFLLCGIGSEDTRADIRDPGDGNWSYRVETNATGSTQIVSVNTLLKDFQDDRFVPFLIKIDIEGFEENLFQKNTEWIDRFPIIVIELHDWMLPGQGNARYFLKEISSRDRDFVFYGENVFSISNTLLGR